MTDISSIAAMAETLRRIATAGMRPKELVAAVREKHPEATKKEIVRAAFYAITDGRSIDQGRLAELHDFAINERATVEDLPAKVGKLKSGRKVSKKSDDSQSPQ